MILMANGMIEWRKPWTEGHVWYVRITTLTWCCLICSWATRLDTATQPSSTRPIPTLSQRKSYLANWRSEVRVLFHTISKAGALTPGLLKAFSYSKSLLRLTQHERSQPSPTYHLFTSAQHQSQNICSNCCWIINDQCGRTILKQTKYIRIFKGVYAWRILEWHENMGWREILPRTATSTTVTWGV